MKIDPNHLEILAAIVDHKGVTDGAKALNKSQPSVSRSLAALEERLGIALFEANRRPLKPTAFCLRLAEEGRKISAAGRTASAMIQQQKSGQIGAVRLAGTPIFMDGVIAPIIAAFQARYPDIQIHQSYGYLTELLAQLRSGALDLAVAPIRSDEIPCNLATTQILRGQNVIACRIGHPLARTKNIQLSQIAQFPWIAPPPDSPLFHDLQAALNKIGVKDFKVSFSGGSLASVTNILATSDALTVLPRSVVDRLARQNALAALDLSIGDPDRHLHVIAARDMPRTSPTAHLAAFVERQFLPLTA